MKIKNTQRIIEIIAWTTFLVLPLFLFPTVQPLVSSGLLNPALQGVLITHSLLIVFYYFNYYFAIPRIFFTNKKLYAVILLSCVTILTFILLADSRFNPFPSPPFRYPVFTFILSILLRFMIITLISLGLVHIERLEQTERKKIQTELSYLKSQINPHFLFNTLNSIYALTVKKSDLAPESVTKLSAIMRYVISEATADFVPLEKEIKYISSYIELERLRLTPMVDLTYSVTGNFPGKKIAPLIFIALVENAFKHGVSTREKCHITIRIELVENKLRLSVVNNIHKADQKNSIGFGLDNLRKRLQLLYAGKHELIINESSSEFSAKLVLDLND